MIRNKASKWYSLMGDIKKKIKDDKSGSKSKDKSSNSKAEDSPTRLS